MEVSESIFNSLFAFMCIWSIHFNKITKKKKRQNALKREVNKKKFYLQKSAITKVIYI